MVKRRLAVIATLLYVCLCLLPCRVMAASTADASDPINVEEACSLTISYVCEGIAFADVPVRLYKVATVSADFQYTLTDAFSRSGLALNGVRTNGEWDAIRSTLESCIVANGIEADRVVKTDVNGQAAFSPLKTGLYLAVVGTVTQDDLHCVFDSALVALPGLSAEGNWKYHVSVVSKAEIVEPSVKDVEYKVVKLWKGDEGDTRRPTAVEVDIYRDGALHETVVLSKENNWTYSWTAQNNGAKWTVTERNLPSAYTMTVEERATSFVMTNTYTPEVPEEPPTPPHTGDTFHVMLYVMLLLVSGGALIILSIAGKRKAHEETT